MLGKEQKTAIMLSIDNSKRPNNCFIGLHVVKYICRLFCTGEVLGIRIKCFSKLMKKEVYLPKVARPLSRTLYNAQKFGAQYA